PPSGPVAREDDVAGRAPLRLPDGLAAVEPRDALDLGDRAVACEARDMQLASVPRHPREVPGEETEPGAVRRDARVRVEVATAHDHTRLGRAVRTDRDELVHDVARAIALGVALPDSDPEAAVGSDAAVCVPMPPLGNVGGYRDRDCTRV